MKKTKWLYSGIAMLCLLVIGGCASKSRSPASKPPVQGETIADLREFPQNLKVYADAGDRDKRLLSIQEQDDLAHDFARIYFGPWEMARTSVRPRDVAPLFKKARGYKDGESVWTQPEWDAMAANARLSGFPSRAQAAITLRQTDLRELPTHARRFTEPTSNIRENPFDYFQYSLLAPGMPLLIAHTTMDGRWHYVECPIASGWVDAADVALADADFRHVYRNGKYAAIIRENVNLPGIGPDGGDGKAGIGAIFPLVSKSAAGVTILVPVADKYGRAEAAEIYLPADDAAPQPIPLTPARVAAIGNAAMGQPYGWGGTLGQRDCSSLMRDLFAPFGIWLPRNSQAQARRGRVISLAGMTAQEKAAAIITNGIPFLSLVGMRGHIGLYVGKWHGRPAIFHNTWGLRVVKDGDDNQRLVIGRTVVTSITPGMEVENLYRPVTFVDRLRSLTILGDRGK